MWECEKNRLPIPNNTYRWSVFMLIVVRWCLAIRICVVFHKRHDLFLKYWCLITTTYSLSDSKNWELLPRRNVKINYAWWTLVVVYDYHGRLIAETKTASLIVWAKLCIHHAAILHNIFKGYLSFTVLNDLALSENSKAGNGNQITWSVAQISSSTS